MQQNTINKYDYPYLAIDLNADFQQTIFVEVNNDSRMKFSQHEFYRSKSEAGMVQSNINGSTQAGEICNEQYLKLSPD